MVSKLHIENFRSIEKADIDLGRITVLTGSNNSGKSSLMYGLLTLKTLGWNPNQTLNNIFNSPLGINLGDFSDVVFDNDRKRRIGLGVTLTTTEEQIQLSNRIFIDNYADVTAFFDVKEPFCDSHNIKFSLPYNFSNHSKDIWGSVNYNGFYLNPNENIRYIDKVLNVVKTLNSFNPELAFITVRRGFTKPSFVNVPISVFVNSEDEIATEIDAHNLVDKISHYLEIIANRSLTISRPENSGIIFLHTTNTETNFKTNIVNEGTGTNQLVMMLAQALNPQRRFICIDEPEIHLHPSMIEKLVECLVEIAYSENKQFMLSTHSEHFVTCLLSEVVKKNLKPDDLKVYYLTKEGQKSQIEHQSVNEDGQLEGGLKNFYESELRNIETFFKLA